MISTEIRRARRTLAKNYAEQHCDTSHQPFRTNDVWESYAEGFRANLFGVLQDLVWSEFYRSDAYHTAIWISQHVKPEGEEVFFFGVRGSGTDIGTDWNLISGFNDEVYIIRINYNNNSGATFTVSKMKGL